MLFYFVVTAFYITFAQLSARYGKRAQKELAPWLALSLSLSLKIFAKIGKNGENSALKCVNNCYCDGIIQCEAAFP